METLPLICIALTVVIPQYYFFAALLNRASVNINLRNDLPSLAYAIIELGPGVTSYSVVEILTNSSDKSQERLTYIFVIGLLLTYFGRKLRDVIATKTKPQKNENTKATWSSLFKKEVKESSNG